MSKQRKQASQKKNVPKKRKRGRPKEQLEEKIDFDLVEKYASLGLTDEEIGSLLGVTERTINRYKVHPDFLSALKRGKLKADANVIQSLYKRANGFEYEEVTKEPGIIGYDKEDKPIHGMVTTRIVRKQVVPETLAINTWLNNRRHKDWKRNRDHVPEPINDDHFNELLEAAHAKMVCFSGAGQPVSGNTEI